VSPSFGPNSLKAFEPLMNLYFSKFISGLEQRAEENNGIVEMNEWFHNLSFDVNILRHQKLTTRLPAAFLWA